MNWIEGAIPPKEMDIFLKLCDDYMINTIIESGRQDGYSTWRIGEWVKLRVGRFAISIDLEEDEKRAIRCRNNLSKSPVALTKGNGYIDIFKYIATYSLDRIALLVDGPKGYPAIATMYAAAPYVTFMAIHYPFGEIHGENLGIVKPWRLPKIPFWKFRLYQPWLIRFLWQLRFYDTILILHKISNRLWGVATYVQT